MRLIKLIEEVHAPQIPFCRSVAASRWAPSAVRACELLGVRQVLPMHYGMFPLLTGAPTLTRTLIPLQSPCMLCSVRDGTVFRIVE